MAKKKGRTKSTTSSRTPPASGNGGFWKSKTVEELAAEQGISIPQDINALLGAGKDLWADDAEFEAFLAHLEAIRREEG